MRLAGRDPEAAAERSGHFIPKVGSNRKIVSFISFKEYDRKKREDFRVKVTSIHTGKSKPAEGRHQDMSEVSMDPRTMRFISCDKSRSRVGCY